jgi:hypothetical protein
VGIYHDVVIVKVVEGVDDIFEFVVKEGRLAVINNG